MYKLCFLGYYFVVNFRTNDCIHLPKKWKNRISSISTNKCITLYTQENCKTEKLKATIIKNKVYIEENIHNSKSNISSFNLYGSL